ncbi:MAG: GNAT family N-acetyltransferase [Cyanobacteria bacterium SIG28]|nr:GNAT family N-acetyltransferase [Cyanobacteria bacterium SIG28]
MINNITTNVDTRMQQQMSVMKANPSHVSVATPPILAFKTIPTKEKATLRTKKFKRSDGIVIIGEMDESYLDIVEEDFKSQMANPSFNFFQLQPQKKKTAYLKDCYVIDYIQSPKHRCGLGTEAIKALAEKAMFDKKIEGRIVTFSAPVWKESSPALFFYKLGFRFTIPQANQYMEECLIKNVPDIPAQLGMMYLPKNNLHKLLRYGELF